MAPTSIPSMKQAAAALQGFSIAEKNKTAVIIGGAQGIGAAVTPLLAEIGCKRIFILGRNVEKGEAMVKKAQSCAPSGSDVEISFIPADVLGVAGMQKAVEDIGETVGKGGIDYLLQMQNGMPNGVMDLTPDGIEKGFAVQAVSRFVITYLLIEGGYLSQDAISFTFANPGQNFKDLQVDDLNLQERFEKGRAGFGLFLDQSARDSCVLDVIYLELQRRYPQYKFFHATPGLIKHETFTTVGLPWQAKVLFAVAGVFISSSSEYIATMPIYTITHPEDFGEERFLSWNMAPTKPSPWAVSNATACWAKLREITGMEKLETQQRGSA